MNAPSYFHRIAPSWAVGLLVLMGCGERSDGHGVAPVLPEPGAAMTSGSVAGAPPQDCVGTSVVASKRVVRLSEHQLHQSYTSLFGAEAAAVIARSEPAPSPLEREFPPISADVGVSETLVGSIDRLAQSAMLYVSANAATVTECGAVPTDKRCVQEYLLTLAERAFRRPLSVPEQRAIVEQLWTEMMATGATLGQALGFGVYAILSSPGFVYRTEFGADVTSDGPLTPYETASALSFFLTDGPPDDELLAAAAAGPFDTEQLGLQASRLLATAAVRGHLERALLSYFSLGNAASVILNPEATPGLVVTAGMQAAIFHEAELFLRNTLWSNTLNTLLTSRQIWTNAEIATEVYRTTVPREVDVDGFGPVDLSSDRSGLLTLSSFLLSGARSTGSSPVARGLTVNRAFVCGVNPPFPQAMNPETGELEADPLVTEAIERLASESELQKAAYRANAPECAGCHHLFDPYGMVLEPYDAVGRRRSEDSAGRPIDDAWTTTTLPEAVGGALVSSAAEAARALVDSEAFERCLAMNFINYALAEVSRGGANSTSPGSQTASCAVERVMDGFAGGDRSFASLMREIAASDAFLQRRGGG